MRGGIRKWIEFLEGGGLAWRDDEKEEKQDSVHKYLVDDYT